MLGPLVSPSSILTFTAMWRLPAVWYFSREHRDLPHYFVPQVSRASSFYIVMSFDSIFVSTWCLMNSLIMIINHGASFGQSCIFFKTSLSVCLPSLNRFSRTSANTLFFICLMISSTSNILKYLRCELGTSMVHSEFRMSLKT